MKIARESAESAGTHALTSHAIHAVHSGPAEERLENLIRINVRITRLWFVHILAVVISRLLFRIRQDSVGFAQFLELFLLLLLLLVRSIRVSI